MGQSKFVIATANRLQDVGPNDVRELESLPLETFMKRTSLYAMLSLTFVACLALTGCKEEPAEVPAEPKAETAATMVEEPKLTPEEQALAAAQKVCPVTGEPLDSMGGPIKVVLGDRTLFVCCEGCIDELKANAEKFLAKIDAAATETSGTTPALEEPAKDDAPKAG
jgi:hypothetical protein